MYINTNTANNVNDTMLLVWLKQLMMLTMIMLNPYARRDLSTQMWSRCSTQMYVRNFDRAEVKCIDGVLGYMLSMHTSNLCLHLFNRKAFLF